MKVIRNIILTAVAFVSIISCAKMGALSGGPEDKEPPVAVFADPPNASVNFAATQVKIRFNEYIILKNVQQALIISPPIDPKPEVLVSGKNLIINIEPGALRENTTYNLNFGDAVADNNEGNPLKGFTYSFSTGNLIDSLMVSGTLVDALTLKPIEGASVVLYKEGNDSLFFTTIPQYLSVTDANGKFSLQYLAEANYLIYAISDANYNYYFDQPSEPIAFTDAIIYPTVSLATVPGDTAKQQPVYAPANVLLKMFTEDYQKQYIKSAERKEPGKVQIIFNMPNRTIPEISLPDDVEFLISTSATNDTLTLWLTYENMSLHDSLNIYCSYYDKTTDGVLVYDTIRITKPLKNENSLLQFSGSRHKELYSDYLLNFSHPIVSFDSSKIVLQNVESPEKRIDFTIASAIKPEQMLLKANLAEGEEYVLHCDEGAFSDCYGGSTKSDSIRFTVKTEADYGSLIISIPTAPETCFAELLVQNKVKYSVRIADNRLAFMNISPGKYTIRIITDSNSNGVWDTGNLLLNRQPEAVYYYNSEYEVRSKWQHELEWQQKFNEQGQ